ncbi:MULTISPECIES: flavodoxin family protein [unclassified Methanoregula]|uniref:flavodoxin family protein n=1 Tax=unclassified Methanoregula TaxID=2649730 RepID=UPI0009CA96A0|nr:MULTISPECIES: flavodoxin family protein [unclassified Methanoregula]OPX61946.1 MAG: Iron-sulfur flavoprotein [Methanoregula sp. PtaB.Bin085]OPY34379.1 MAG: Iron-sulfur flavoprotein [Methanoregula sp. PtaU1.Bin006]
MLMEPARETMEEEVVRHGSREFVLTLSREDFSSVYPGMVRYILSAREGDLTRAVFRTNTFEYSPQVPLAAETAVRDKVTAWKRELVSDPDAVFSVYPPDQKGIHGTPGDSVIILQGSPRPDGNCSILAGLAAEAAREAGQTVRIIYPHDLDIHCCIGCYQCYNTGTCVFDDDMTGIINAVRGARLFIVCSPVYTNTVPAGLKLVIDRMQAYHAERTLHRDNDGKKGLLLSVAGRMGEDNFSCITKVIIPFFRNLGIEPAGHVLIDSMDALKDIRQIPGRVEEVKKVVTGSLRR